MNWASNRLLHQGAKPCLDAEDLIEAVLPDGPRHASLLLPPGLTSDAQRVMEALREGPGESDALARELGLSPADFAAVLLERPATLPGWIYHRWVRDRRRGANPLDNGDSLAERNP